MISLGKTLKVSIIFATVSLKVSALSLNPLSVTASIDNVSVQTPNGPILIQDIGEIAFELELIDKPIISSASLDVDGQNYSLSSDQKPNGFSLEYGYTDQSNPEQLYDLELSSENINWNSYTLGRTFNFSLTTSETPITYSHNLPPESAIPIAPNVSVEGNNVWESDSDGVTRMNINKNSSYLFTWDPFTDSDSLDYISVQLQEFTENQDIPITNEIILPPESTSHTLSVSLDHNKLYTYYVSFVNVTEQSSPSGFTHAIGTNDSEPFLETRAISITALDFKVSDGQLAPSSIDGMTLLFDENETSPNFNEYGVSKKSFNEEFATGIEEGESEDVAYTYEKLTLTEARIIFTHDDDSTTTFEIDFSSTDSATGTWKEIDGNQIISGIVNISIVPKIDGSVFQIFSEDEGVSLTLSLENGIASSSFTDPGEGITYEHGSEYSYTQFSDSTFGITLSDEDSLVFDLSDGTGYLTDYNGNGDIDESGSWNFTFEQYSWEDYDDFSGSNLDTSKWGVQYLAGGNKPYVSDGKIILSGDGANTNTTNVFKAGWSDIFEGDDTGQSWIYAKDPHIYGIEAEFIIPSDASSMSGLQIGVGSLTPFSYGTVELNADPSYTSEYTKGFGFYQLVNDSEIESFGSTNRDVTHRMSAILINGQINLLVDGEVKYTAEAGTFNTDIFWLHGYNDFNDQGLPFELEADNVRVLRRNKEPEPVTIISTPSDQPVVVKIGGNYNWASDLDGVMLWSVEKKDSGTWSSSTAKFDNGNLFYAFEFADNVTDSGNNKAPYEIDANGYIKSLEQDGEYQYYNVVSVENGIIETLEGDQGVESVNENGINEVDQWFFTTRSAAEEFYGDLSGEDWATYDDIGETTSNNYLDGYAPDSIDGFNVRVFEDGETFNTTFSNGIRTDSTGDSALYTYEKTSANEGTITLLFENETGLNPEVTTIKFLSPNNGSFIWREYSNNSFQTVLDQGSGTWHMNAGFEREEDSSIPESNSLYPTGYALDSIDGLKVTIWDGSDSETLTFTNGYRYNTEEDTTKYIYEKTGANEGKITYPFENEGGTFEISLITFLSPNHGTYSWTDYSDSTTNTVLDTSAGNWAILPGSVRSNLQEGYYTGGSATQVSEGKYVLSGTASSGSNLVKMPPELTPIIGDDPAGNSFLFIDEAKDVVGIEGKVMLPSTNSIDSGVYISLWDAFPLESIGIELVKTEDDKASLRFESDENGYTQDISIPAELDQNYTLRVTHRLGKSTFYVDGEEVGELRTGSTPDYWGFGAFNKEGLSDYNGTVSDIKILNKYLVEDYSKTLVETSNGNPVGLHSNDNDFSWGIDLNGTTLWSVSPDLSYQRFKYEFKGDHVTRTTINQWDDNEIEEVLKLPYSISEDGVLLIEGAPHGDEYLNLIGIDENGTISAKYGSTEKESEYQEFTQFSYPIATEDNKAMTLQISDNGEVANTFAIVDENNNIQMIFDSITDVIDFLKVQEDNATLQKWVELTNKPVIETLEYYAVENNSTDFFYMNEKQSIESYESLVFDEVMQGPLSFKIFKGTMVDGITHYSRNGISHYSITPSSDHDPSSVSLSTEFKDENAPWDKNLTELATSYAYQLDAEGYSVEITQGTNDHGLEYISINGSYRNNYNEKINSYYILVDLDQSYSDKGKYWLYASLSGSQEPLSSSTYEDALNIAMSLDFNDSWEQPKDSLEDFNQSSDESSQTEIQEAVYDSSVSIPFAVTSYSETATWYNSEWFGDFFQSTNGWIFHLDFGWLYPVTSGESNSCWMYGEDYGWIWIDSYYFPIFYSDVKEGWVYFFKNPSTALSAHFYDYTSEEWFGEENLFEKDEIEEKNTQNYLDWWQKEVNKFW